MAVLANFTNFIPDSSVPPQEWRVSGSSVIWKHSLHTLLLCGNYVFVL